MARPARRDILSDQGGFYHVLNRVAGAPDWYPFDQCGVRREWLRRLRKSLAMSCIRAAAFTLMGNHFHLILFVEKFRRLSRPQLERFARLRWGRLWKLRTRFWSPQRWLQFNRDLFQLKVFMRDFQGPFASWFNRSFRRRGHLWADRYKSLALEDFEALQECLYYIELNPLRAGLASRPQDWKTGSAFFRHSGQDDFLIPLQRLFPQFPPHSQMLRAHYRRQLLARGSRPQPNLQTPLTSPPQTPLGPPRPRPGAYLSTLPFFSDGLVLGTSRAVSRHLRRLQQKGVYKRPRSPVPQLDGLFFTLRPQRPRVNE